MVDSSIGGRTHRMRRKVERELLDELLPSDHRAIVSRRDLQRVNGWLRHSSIMSRTLTGAFSGRSPRSIVELGAGDGTNLLRLAKSIAYRWRPLRVVLVDQQLSLSSQTKAEFKALSWHLEFLEMDVFDWLQRPYMEHCDLTIANLFLHHFTEEHLRRLLWHVARQTGFFLTCEPRRATFSLCGAALLRVAGCNDVTRYDAKISVRAGFKKNELSELWPAGIGWQLTERHAGLFSHYFEAQRIGEGRL
jgi:SAM-dependent methyltransferase